MVADEALEPPDGDRLHLLLEDALDLALRFLRADAAADGGEEVALLDDRERAREVADEEVPDEAGDVDGDGAARDAGGPRALDAAVGLDEGVGQRVAEVHLLEVARALERVALRHLHGVLGRAP